MDARRPARWTLVGLGTSLALGVVPALASAHEVAGSRFDAPLPPALLFAGAGATVALTALWLAVTGRAAPTGRRHVLTVPGPVARPLRRALRAAFLVAVLAALVLGVAGRQIAAENVATVFAWPVWFHGLALVAVLVGTPWPTLSPWQTAYRALVRIEGRPIAVLGTDPTRLGAWPAVAGFVVLLGVVENLTVVPRSPRLTAAALAAYALVMVGGAVLYGPAWLRRADPLAVLYRLLGRVAAVDLSRTDDGGCALALRPPWQGCLDPVEDAPLVVFVVAAVYTVSFDGFVETRLFQATLFAARDALGTGPATSVLLYAAGLSGFVAAFLLASRVVERLGSGAAGTRDGASAARAFAPTLVPIAAAYEVAHAYPHVLGNLGRLLALAVRPVAPGVAPVDPLRWLSLPAFWGSQVVLIVLGHVVAVVAAHGVAVDRYGARARRGHLPLVVLMVGYTVLSLWIVSQPVVSGA
ncbi:MAG: hypothetical protein ABEH78_03205 [Haloferacaceae archaeon]